MAFSFWTHPSTSGVVVRAGLALPCPAWRFCRDEIAQFSAKSFQDAAGDSRESHDRSQGRRLRSGSIATVDVEVRSLLLLLRQPSPTRPFPGGPKRWCDPGGWGGMGWDGHGIGIGLAKGNSTACLLLLAVFRRGQRPWDNMLERNKSS